jgi:pyruvate,water dikinase
MTAESGPGIVAPDAPTWLAFPGAAAAPVALVGGKAEGLVRLAAAGFPVPAGVVLTTRFTAPWIERVKALPEWRDLLVATPAQRPPLCAALQAQVMALPFDSRQTAALDEALAALAQGGAGALHAVRSSSPQEDRAGASFAGGYQTRLAVPAAGLHEAVRACVASLFADRVFAYTRARGLAPDQPAMAVVIQRQLHSDVAGVAFSLNPLNNDLDEAVIDASHGLGDLVVNGEVDPDHWVLDKTSGAIVRERIGGKRLHRSIDAGGRLVDREASATGTACLDTGRLRAVLDLLCRVEAHCGHPVDIEWAFADDTLHLLQARPVTAGVPLPAALATAPGVRRRLYMDIALSSGLTINAPISPLGLDVFRRLLADMAALAFGPSDLASGPDDAMVVLAGSRMYLDLSNVLWLSSPRKLARSMELSDAGLARALAALDRSAWRSSRRPRWAHPRALLLLPGALWRLRAFIGASVRPLLMPLRSRRRLQERIDAFERELRGSVDLTLPMAQFWARHVLGRLRTLMAVSLPVIGPGVLATALFRARAAPVAAGDEALLAPLDRGFEGNVVVELGQAMHALAALLSDLDAGDPGTLAGRLQRGELAPAVQAAWAGFIERFGWRGPMEMDLAHPRYADAPALALAQVLAMPVADPERDPVLAARRQVERRRTATACLIDRAGPVRRWLLRRLAAVVEGYGGLRDTPKHHLLLLLHGLRRRLVAEGEALCAQDRLDDPAHVFDLDFALLAAAATDPSLDLRALRAARRRDLDALAAQVSHFPSLIDSRGRIHRPPPLPAAAGSFAGVGLSPGVASGRTRTLRGPDGTLAAGEVLIAYTTDPGWTPLFVNAAAVVLEIGGALQHGAVVARELGLPCVAGIDGISTAIADGTRVEVDGAAGTVRLLPPD